MGSFVGVGGPRLDATGGSWNAWPIVGLVLALWIGRRVLRIPWGAALLVASFVASLAVPIVVQAAGVVPTAGMVLVLTIVLRLARDSRRGRPDRAV